MKSNAAENLNRGREVFARARMHAEQTEATLAGEAMAKKSHTDLEAFCAKQGREWARLLLEEHLELRADAERRVEVTGSDGVERRRARDSQRKLETIVGPVEVPRMAYQAPGAEDLHPMDAALNLPREKFSFGVRRLVAKEAARASFDDVVEMVADYKGTTIGKRQVEELAVRAAQDFDAFYGLRDLPQSSSSDLLVLSTDSKGINMRPEDLREETKKRAKASRRKLQTRLSGGEKKNRKRMAQVASVYSVAPWERSPADVLHGLKSKETDKTRPKVYGKRVWASVEDSYDKVIRGMFEEALRQDPERRRRWVVLVDGDVKQLRAVKAEARRVQVKITVVLDIVHVIEYVWRAARALFGEANPDAEPWVSDRLLQLIGGSTGGQVSKTIRGWAQRRELKGSRLRALNEACAYLSDRSRTRAMRYLEALQDGLPIATGVIEGACRYVVKDRMDRTGARWSLTGAEAVLRLRAIRASGDFDAYWAFHLEQEHVRNHSTRYADGQIPDPIPTKKPRLKRVK
ncbi:MAG: ISKra4 family transposase [Pseudomonadota bacterium]